MKRNINTETPLIPYIIAENAAWHTIKADKVYSGLNPNEVAEMVSRFTPVLVEKAERIYQHNQNFRLQLLDKRKDPRYTLEMFMEHWCMGLIAKEKMLPPHI